MLALHLPIVAAALALPPPVLPHEYAPGINCPYDSIAAADLLVAAAVARERRPPRGEEAASLARVSAIAQACADEYAWTDSRARAALDHAIAQAVYEKALQALRTHGLDAHFVEAVQAELGESGMAALISSSSDGNLDLLGDAVMRRLDARGLISPGDVIWVRLRREIGRGLVGLVLRNRAAEAFTLQ